MKYLLLSFVSILSIATTFAADKDSVVYYHLPDTIKAVQFLAEIKVPSINSNREFFAGIKTDLVSISLESDKKERTVVFEFPASAMVMAQGMKTDAAEKGEIEWKYNWDVKEFYKLLIATAVDSAGNFSLYSGYIWLPVEKKWKLIGTCKINGTWKTLKNPATFFTRNNRRSVRAEIGQVWCQGQKGNWKNMKEDSLPLPVINLQGHIDSADQHQAEINIIEAAIASGKTDTRETAEGVYYKIIKEGNGKQVSINDTVTVFYKGYLFANDSVFDQTKKNPVSFPLKGLIKGWQSGVPMCKVGGKIKLVIPSALGYSIRTRAAKIPPNSILVFEIEVMDVKPPL